MGFPGRQLGVGGALGPLFEAVLVGPLAEPIPDGLQAVSLLAEPVATLLNILVGPPPWQLHDPEGHSGMGFWVKAVDGFWDRHQGLLLLYLGYLERRDKETSQIRNDNPRMLSPHWHIQPILPPIGHFGSLKLILWFTKHWVYKCFRIKNTEVYRMLWD